MVKLLTVLKRFVPTFEGMCWTLYFLLILFGAQAVLAYFGLIGG